MSTNRGQPQLDVGWFTFELDAMLLLMTARPAGETKSEGSFEGSAFDWTGFMDGRMVPVEVKAKEDATERTTKPVFNTVRTGRKQLPQGEVRSSSSGPVRLGRLAPGEQVQRRPRRRDAQHQLCRSDHRQPSLSSGDPANKFLSHSAAENCPEHI